MVCFLNLHMYVYGTNFLFLMNSKLSAKFRPPLSSPTLLRSSKKTYRVPPKTDVWQRTTRLKTAYHFNIWTSRIYIRGRVMCEEQDLFFSTKFVVQIHLIEIFYFQIFTCVTDPLLSVLVKIHGKIFIELVCLCMHAYVLFFI